MFWYKFPHAILPQKMVVYTFFFCHYTFYFTFDLCVPGPIGEDLEMSLNPSLFVSRSLFPGFQIIEAYWIGLEFVLYELQLIIINVYLSGGQEKCVN